MMSFLRAHGMDPGPLQRPLLAGAIAGAAATIPAGAVFAAFGSFDVVAEGILRAPRPLAGLLLFCAFTLAGPLYGLAFRRAANDPRGGWLFGAVFAFILWTAAPVMVLPLLGAGAMAGGRAAEGFLAAFLVWGVVLGGLFPRIHRPLHARWNGERGARRLGPAGAAVPRSILRPRPTYR